MRSVKILFGVFLTACQASEPPARGVSVSFAAACDKDNQGRRVMIEGFVDFPQQFGDSDTTIIMRVRASLASWEGVVGANAKIGRGANNVEMPPPTYNKTHLRLHLADGRIVGYSNKVRVSGTVYYPSVTPATEFRCALADTQFEPGPAR